MLTVKKYALLLVISMVALVLAGSLPTLLPAAPALLGQTMIVVAIASLTGICLSMVGIIRRLDRAC